MWHSENHFWGMHLFWWIIWVILLIWIFLIPMDIPGNKKSKSGAIDILDQKFAEGKISKEEYQEKKELIQKRQ